MSNLLFGNIDIIQINQLLDMLSPALPHAQVAMLARVPIPAWVNPLRHAFKLAGARVNPVAHFNHWRAGACLALLDQLRQLSRLDLPHPAFTALPIRREMAIPPRVISRQQLALPSHMLIPMHRRRAQLI